MKVSKGIPIPTKGARGPKLKKCPFPFQEMSEGDSFYIKRKNHLEDKSRLNRIRWWAKRDELGITVRTLKNGYRVWRTG